MKQLLKENSKWKNVGWFPDLIHDICVDTGLSDSIGDSWTVCM